MSVDFDLLFPKSCGVKQCIAVSGVHIVVVICFLPHFHTRTHTRTHKHTHTRTHKHTHT